MTCNTLEVDVVDDAAVSFSDLEPHPTSAPETATDNKTREQTRITFSFHFHKPLFYMSIISILLQNSSILCNFCNNYVINCITVIS